MKTQRYEVTKFENGSWILVASGIESIDAIDFWMTEPGKRYRVYQLEPRRMLVSELTA